MTTGSEVYHGRIKDAFGPVVEKKFKALGSQVMRQILVSDDQMITVAAIGELISEGAEMVMVTGGMSVDPDDQTPASIRAAGGESSLTVRPFSRAPCSCLPISETCWWQACRDVSCIIAPVFSTW